VKLSFSLSTPEVVEIQDVSIVDGVLKLSGYEKEFGTSVEFEPDDAYAGQLSSIIDYLPDINGISDVSIPTTYDKEPWYCSECGSTNVEQKVWINPVTHELGSNEGLDIEDCYCNCCDNKTRQVEETDFVEILNDWYESYHEPENFTGILLEDFQSEEEYYNANRKYWDSLPIDEKIRIWKSFTGIE